MTKLASHNGLDGARLLFDLKRCEELVSEVAGCLDGDEIASTITTGLVNQFGCVFSRIWLVEPERHFLRLVASAGLYTRLDGSFARVPMGHYKVGKIAQNCIPFLSNALPDERWVKDRQWAIENGIKGFAGLPLMAGGSAIGVMAVFSHQALASEFLEVLQMLSVSVAGILSGAMRHQDIVRSMRRENSIPQPVLSEQLVSILGQQKLSLLGTECSLDATVSRLLVQVAHNLAELPCHYCRLVYEDKKVTLEAMLATSDPVGELLLLSDRVEELGGLLETQIDDDRKITEVRLQLPQNLQQESGRETIVSPLSEREREVIELLASGLRDREIAERLFISERTVKFHTKNMLAKLQVKTRVQAVFEASQQGWLRR